MERRSNAIMQFHILSIEGPDVYARAGGIASRITGLSEARAEPGAEDMLADQRRYVVGPRSVVVLVGKRSISS
jgi:hypothetical protein